jgi:Glycosyltransferase family 87
MLSLLLLLSIGCNSVLSWSVPPPTGAVTQFVTIWMVSFVPYFAACAVVLATKGPPVGRWHWLELGLIFGGALVLRLMLLPIWPVLSHDAWRYLWDASVILHGYNPYVLAPNNNILAPLQDSFIFAQSRFRNVPTIYPPGAQGIYVLSYLLAPGNLTMLKVIFLGFDMVTCCVLAVLLQRRKLSPQRVIIYAWCPLPIVEFAVQAHLDVLAITYSLLVLLCAGHDGRKWRVLTGFLVGMATLAKLYPLLLLVVVLRRRDWALLATCFSTIFLGYLPFLILGHGQVLGFFADYSSEQSPNGGMIQKTVYWLTRLQLGFPDGSSLVVDVMLMGIVCLLVLWLRRRERISMECGTLLLFGTVFAVSPHIFPWYTAVLLPLIAVVAGPLRVGRRLSGKGIAVIVAWYFTWTVLIGYFYQDARDWSIFYLLVYDVVVAGLVIAALVEIFHLWRMRCLSR